jgi:hypothetical protein
MTLDADEFIRRFLIQVLREELVAADDEPAGLLLDERGEGGIDLASLPAIRTRSCTPFATCAYLTTPSVFTRKPSLVSVRRLGRTHREPASVALCSQTR